MTTPRRRICVTDARRSVLWLLAIVLLSHLALAVSMETWAVHWRDPEYGRKLLRLRSLSEVAPDRPLVLILGSSRVSMGVRPAVLQDSESSASTEPLLFNASLVGSGPVMELLCLRRLLTDGIRPAAVIVEVWPPFQLQSGAQKEQRRLDVNRLRRDDLPTLANYFDDLDQTRRDMRWARLVPWFTHRFYLMSQTVPTMLPWNHRRDFCWAGMDEFGWLPGLEDDPDPVKRKARVDKASTFYAPILADWHPDPQGDQALAELLDTCREHRIPVSLILLPESSEFRALYSDSSRQNVEAWLNKWRNAYGVPVFDCRTWVDDVRLLDGFHLTREGAAEFTRRLARELLPILPGVRR